MRSYAALAAAGIAPPYLGRFGNGRIEGWLEARALEVREMGIPDLSQRIAQQMAQLHLSFEIPPTLKEFHSELSLWKQLYSWMDQALKATFQNERDASMAKKLELHKIPAELKWLQHSIISKDAKTSFCHNDLLAANLMVNDKTGQLHLIDFEYGGINYVAFDIANHFNEFAGGTDIASGTPNFDWLPSPALQRRFVEAYLGQSTTPKEVENMLIEVQAFRLVNNLYWGLWAANQADTEGCEEFDFIVYATHRVTQYFKCKEEYLKDNS